MRWQSFTIGEGQCRLVAYLHSLLATRIAELFGAVVEDVFQIDGKRGKS